MSLKLDIAELVTLVTGIASNKIVSPVAEGGNSPSGLHCSIYFKPSAQYGISRADYSESGTDFVLNETVTTDIYHTAVVQFMRTGANAAALKMVGIDQRSDVQAFLRSRSLGLYNVKAPVDLTSIHQSDYEERAAIELLVGVESTYQSTVGQATNVDITVNDEDGNTLWSGNSDNSKDEPANQWPNGVWDDSLTWNTANIWNFDP